MARREEYVHGRGHRAAPAVSEDHDEREAAHHHEAKQVAALRRRALEETGFLVQPDAVEQQPRGGEDRHQDPQPVHPTARGLAQVGLEHRPVRQEPVEPNRDDRR